MDPNHARELLARERRRVEEALARLRREPDEELEVLTPERLPPNDGGIAYGQLAVAAARLAAEEEGLDVRA